MKKPPELEKLYRRLFLMKDQVTADQYVDSQIFDANLYKTKLIHIQNKHETYPIAFRVLGSVGNDGWREVKRETVIQPGLESYEVLTEKIDSIKVQVRSIDSGKSGVVDVAIEGLSE